MNKKEAIDNNKWDIIIEPNNKIFDLKLKEIWQYRDLIYIFVRRDFVAQYKQTILGPAWHFVQPLLTTIMFTIIFGKIASIPTAEAPPFIFYMAGTIIWSYFSNILNSTSTTFTSNAHIFGKVYFPRLAVPISQVASKLIGFSVQFILFTIFILYFIINGAAIKPNALILITPILLLNIAALGLGMGAIISALTTRYRDLAVLIGFGTQLFMYATPVIYPLSIVPEKYQWMVALNPLTPIFETFRLAFLGTGSVNITQFITSTIVTGIIAAWGAAVFNKAERTFMDTV